MNDNCSMSDNKIKEEIIRKACSGDGSAMCVLVNQYQNYVKKSIRNKWDCYDFYNNEIPVEDISQIVWAKFTTRKIFGFTELD